MSHLKSFGVGSCALLVLLISVAWSPASASAKTTRLHQSSFGSFNTTPAPRGIGVDQETGDVYVSAGPSIYRFDSSGAAKNFTSGPNAGTNVLKNIGHSSAGVIAAIDNSGGPLNGAVYVTTDEENENAQVRVFDRSGLQLGAIVKAGGEPSQQEAEEGVPADRLNTPCGVAVDQTNGDVYVAEHHGSASASNNVGHIWRYRPNAPSGSISDADYTLSGIAAGNGCDVAADAGRVYLAREIEGKDRLVQYSASDFGSAFSTKPTGSTVDWGTFSGVTAVAVDPANGEVYANEGNRIVVFNASGTELYSFGFAAQLGADSEGIGVRSAGSGPASKAFVSVATRGSRQIDVFGSPVLAPSFTHSETAAFGPDGTDSSVFGSGPYSLAFDQSAGALFASDGGGESPAGIYGFDALAPSAFPPLVGFTPLAAPPADRAGLAVDNTASASGGNLYFASNSTDLLYGWDASGATLAGFPVDPAAAPGAAAGSPKDLCGAGVDSNGDIWVSNATTKRILAYTPSGAFTGDTIDTSAQGSPCQIAFDGEDDLYTTFREEDAGTWKYTAESGYASAAKIARGSAQSVAVDAESNHAFLTRFSTGVCRAFVGGCALAWVDEYEPSGQLVDEFVLPGAIGYSAVTVESDSGYVYVGADGGAGNGGPYGRRVRVFTPGLLLPEVATRPPTAVGNSVATLIGTVVAQEVALEDCHFEYVSEASFHVSGFDDLSSGGSAPCAPGAGSIPLDLEAHDVTASATGLQPNTAYRFRLLASNENGSDTSEDAAFSSAGPPIVETTGSPVRAATTARLQGRVLAHGEATTFHFEYGADGPCSGSPCQASASRDAGAASQVRTVAQALGGLSPATTYHYRLVAENGNPAGPAYGEDMTLTTRGSNTPLSHGDFPGPPGSDRGWEQVNLADTGGNPVGETAGFSSRGDRALYGIFGGTPIAESGSFLSLYFSQRPAGAHPATGWQTGLITPRREELIGSSWFASAAADDLSFYVGINGEAAGRRGLFRLSPEQPALGLFELGAGQDLAGGGAGYAGASADGSTVLADLQGGSLDPDHPAAASVPNLYSLGDGDPQLVSLLPGEALAACGFGAAGGPPHARTNWISDDGSEAVFPSRGNGSCTQGPAQLYLRDLDAEQTMLISGPPLSGMSCSADLVKLTTEAAFFTTGSRLDSGDADPEDCAAGNDVYRYDLGSGEQSCLTCLVPGLSAAVEGAGSADVSVSGDGSRLYFATKARLVPDAPQGANGLYRLRIQDGDLAFVAPVSAAVGFSSPDVGISSDGSFFSFRAGSPALDPLGDGERNGGTAQLYVYDDRRRSLNCASCPVDGSPAQVDVAPDAYPIVGPNNDGLADDGTFAFATPNSLVGADQNTSTSASRGTDVYEWRDGRTLLVSDGLGQWPAKTPPRVRGITPSGRDLFFSAPAQYTPDAPDAYIRLYDARIGGGIDFPEQPKPCPLEVCQGVPKGAPEEAGPASASFAGPGNKRSMPTARRCPKGKRRVRRAGKRRCVKKHRRRGHRRHRRANHHGRNVR